MRCALCGEPAWYRCAQTGVFVCPRHARMEVVSAKEAGQRKPSVVRDAGPEDRRRLKEVALHFWGETEVECFDGLYDVLQLPAFVAEVEGDLAGFLSYAVEGERMNLVMLSVLPEYQGRGVGQALLEAAVQLARGSGLKRLVVATTNDDLPVLCLYQRLGFVITALTANGGGVWGMLE
jgi:ribosomal protein S18 acetylase RimI-like enzyme